MKKFFITTPIYYINAEPTIGSAYTTVIADVFARWHHLKNEKVFFLTGLDEHSTKTVKAAKEKGFKNIKKYGDEMAKKWKNVWRVLNIDYDDFIRTSEERHKKNVIKIFKIIYKKGDVYKGTYEGLYCDGCEAFLSEVDLIEGECPYHKTRPKTIVEENYFFKLSKYQNKILNYIEEHDDFIKPKFRKKEIINFIKNGLRDTSISRPNLKWAIKLPVEEEQYAWTWFDAILNYLINGKYWPTDLHLMAKDILRFHAILFPCLLFSLNKKLPKHIFAHGFLTVNGQKMSKSLGNAIDPIYLSKRYSTDALRYFLIKEIPFGEDGDFSEEALKARINGELVADLGNLVNRTLTLVEKNKVKLEGRAELEKELKLKKIESSMEKLELHSALEEIWNFVRACNKYVNDKQAWKLEEKKLNNVLYNLVEALRIIAILISPFTPETAKKINKQLGVKAGNLKDCKFKAFKGKIKKGEILFKKV